MEEKERIPVYLLKTKSTPTDRYEELIGAVSNGAYNPIFVPVLEHGLIDSALENIEQLILSKAFSSKETRKYGGVIFTSQRAVEAFATVISKIRGHPDINIDEYFTTDTVFYVVGQATHRAVAAIGLVCPIRGEDTGNGETLAEFILKDYHHGPSAQKRPALLFPVGEQRRDIIPRTLQSSTLPDTEQIQVDELTVYQTIENPGFRSEFQSLISGSGDSAKWVVVFSPSGCQTMLSVLGLLDTESGRYNGHIAANTKIATIGPTTRDFLIDEFGFTPDAMAEKPAPEGVRDAITNKRFD